MKSSMAILAATAWIGLSEFFRNQFLLVEYWTRHYESMGLIFPSSPINGAVWGIWSLCFAIFVFILSRKFNVLQTTIISWFAGFVLMWITIGNLNVLPFSILWLAVPLSILETYIATLIITKISK